MTSIRRLLLVAIVGTLAMGGAWGVHHHSVMSEQHAQLAAFHRRFNQELRARQMVIDSSIARARARVNANPKDLNARWALADLYQKLDKLDLAAGELESIRKIQPANRDVLVAIANVRLALKEYSKAEARYREITQRWPTEGDGWQGLAATLYHETRYSEALDAARHAVSLQPDDPSSQYLEATAALEDALQFPNPSMRSAELRQARLTLTRLLGTMPNSGDLYYRLGRSCVALRDNNGAIRYLESARKLLPDRLDISSALANVFNQTGNRAAARRVVMEALQKHPKAANLYSMLGEVEQLSGEPGSDGRALMAYRKAAMLAPKDPRLLERLGVSLLRNNRLQEARSAFLSSLKLYPNRAFSYQQLAAIYTRLGDTRRATMAAKAAREMVFNDQQLKQIQSLSVAHPNEPMLHLSLADRYRELDMLVPARDEYLMTLKLDPQNKQAQKGLEQLLKDAKAKGVSKQA